MNFANIFDFTFPNENAVNDNLKLIYSLPDGLNQSIEYDKFKLFIMNHIGLYNEDDKSAMEQYELLYTKGRIDSYQYLIRYLIDEFIIKTNQYKPHIMCLRTECDEVKQILAHEEISGRLSIKWLDISLSTEWTPEEQIRSKYKNNLVLFTMQLVNQFGLHINKTLLNNVASLMQSLNTPFSLDISHCIGLSKLSLTNNIPIIIGDSRYFYGIDGFGFMLIDKRLISGWNISSLSKLLGENKHGLGASITRQSLQYNFNGINIQNSIKYKVNFVNSLIDLDNEFIDLDIYINKYLNKKHKITKNIFVLVLNPKNQNCSINSLSFFVILSNNSNNIQTNIINDKMIVNASKLKEKLIIDNNIIIKNINLQNIGYDLEELEHTIVLSFLPNFTNNDIKILIDSFNFIKNE